MALKVSWDALYYWAISLFLGGVVLGFSRGLIQIDLVLLLIWVEIG